MNKLSIAILCYSKYGGSGVVATELGIELAKKGHRIHFISDNIPFRLHVEYENITFHSIGVANYDILDKYSYFIFLASKIFEICREYDLDVIHAHYAIPYSMVCYFLSKMLSDYGISKTRFVNTLHGTDVTLLGLDRMFYDFVRISIENSHAVTVVSDYLKGQLVKNFNITKNVYRIYNFVNEKRFSAKKNTNFSFNSKVVLHVSNFRPLKNIKGVIYCFERVLKLSSAILVFAGDGPEIDLAKNIACRLKILDKIVFLGKVANIEKLFPHADVLIFPSYSESFGLVLLEAMFCGVPTISSNVGGINEVVEEGVTGFMFNPDDYDLMAEKIVEILSNNKLRKKIMINSINRASKVFSRDNAVKEYEKIYYSL